MPEYEITLTGSNLNPDANWTIEQFHQAILASIGGEISTANIITGKIGGAAPSSDIGPWLDGLVWKAWFPTRAVTDGTTTINSPEISSPTILFGPSDIGKTITGSDIPTLTHIDHVYGTGSARMSANATANHAGNATFTINPSPGYQPTVPTIRYGGLDLSFVADLTADRTVHFQDKDGTVALTSDIYVPRATVFPDMETPPILTQIDWSLSASFGFTLDKSIELENVNSAPGQSIAIVAYNATGLAHLIDWDSSDVKWIADTPPVMSDGTAAGVADMYILRNIAGQIYGFAYQEYA